MSKLAEIEIDGNGALGTLHRISEGIEKLEHKVKAFGLAFAGFGVAFEAIMKIAEGFEGVLQYGAKLEALHGATGASIHDLVIFGHALDITGGSAESAQNFIFKLQNAIAGVNEDGGNTAKALKLLGTNANELRHLPLLDQVQKLSEGLQKIPDQATRVAAVKDLFGFRFAAQAMPLLGNPEALAKAKEQAGAMADVMDRDAHKFHELEAALKGAQLNFKGFFAGALEGIAPDAKDVADAFSRIDFVDIGRGVGEILDVFVKLAEVLLPLIGLLNSVAEKLEKVHALGPVTGAAIGAGIGTFIEPGGGTLVGAGIGGLMGVISEFLGGGEKKKGFAEDFKGLNAAPIHRDSISSLQRAGLGGGFGGGGDPLLSEAQRHTALLTSIDGKLGHGPGYIPGIPEAPPV